MGLTTGEARSGNGGSGFGCGGNAVSYDRVTVYWPQAVN
jgi:hypothetical protein